MYTEFVRKFSPINLGTITEFNPDGTQNTKNMTGDELLTWLGSEHFHKRTEGKKELKTPHSESLLDHLRMTAESCYEWAVNNDMCNPWKFYLTGFFHDLGKPGCTQVLWGKKLSMKGHGIVSGAIIENMMSDELLAAFSLTVEDLADISAAADYHMCGYHARFPMNGVHMDTFSLLNDEVKELLCALRIADSTSVIPYPAEAEKRAEGIQLAKDTQKTFEQSIMEPNQAPEYCKKYGLDHGVLVTVQGMSGAGKSTLAKQIKNKLTSIYDIKNIGIFSRDFYMVNASRMRMGLKPFETEDTISGEAYREAFEYYESNKKAWAAEINRKMREDISMKLYQGGVAIVDTMATMFPRAAVDVIPKDAAKALRIAIWCHRSGAFTEEETVDRHGVSIQSQLKINRKQDFTNPIGHGLEWHGLVSMTEDIEPDMKTVVRPHMSFSYGWKGVKGEYVDRMLYIIATSIIKHNDLVPRPPAIIDTIHMNLPQMIKVLYDRGGMEMVCEFFTKNYYTIKTAEYDGFTTVVIKYLDGINRIWKPRWAREARGRGYAITSSGEVLVLKESLIRGSEFLTEAHHAEGIEDTQDLESHRDSDILDYWQQKSMEQFNRAENVINDGYITGKVDGAQGNITFYPAGSTECDIMTTVVQKEKAFYLSTKEGLYVPSTSGCLFVPESMEWYVLTSFAGAIGWDLFEKSSRHTNWRNERFQTLLLDKITRPIMEASGGYDRQRTMTFEWVCANRTTFHTGKVHTELAVNYPTSGVYFLGLSEGGKYYPHYEFTAKEQMKDYPQPNWRKVSTAGEVFEIMGDMTAVLKQNMTEAEFGDKWFKGQQTTFHPEGWVFLDASNCDSRYGPTYGKIKHPDYYIFHKFEKYGETRVLAYPTTVDKYYPIVGRLRNFRENTPKYIGDFLDSMRDVLVEDVNVESDTYKGMKPKGRARFDSYIANPNPEDLDVICKMVVNNMGDTLKEHVIDKVCATFGLDKSEREDRIFGLAKSVMMTCQPWKNDSVEMGKKLMNENSPIVMELFKLVVYG